MTKITTPHSGGCAFGATRCGFPVPDSLAKRQHGWTGCLDKLDAALAV